jgi:hypothetical protein
MNGRTLAGILGLIAVGVVTYWVQRPQEVAIEPAPVAKTTSDSTPVVAGEQAPRIRFAGEERFTEEVDEAGESARRAAFHERAREFFAVAPGLDPAERNRRARMIESELDDYEAARALSAGEALLLREALIRETITDPSQQKARLAELAERYRQQSERLSAKQPAPDPEFELYKVREAEIIAEIMAMSEIPDGLTRDEYLRRRLQAEREALLGDR